MSFHAMKWAIEQDVDSPSARCVLMSIANYANADWCAWPKQELIAKEGVQSIDSVQRRMPDLLAKKLVRRIKLKRYGRRTHDFYILGPSRLFAVDIEEIRPLLPSGVEVIDENEAAADCGGADGAKSPKEAANPPIAAAAVCGSAAEPALPQSAVHATAVVRQPKDEPVRNHGGGEGGDAPARAREPLISEQAFELADEIKRMLGIDLEFVPPGWCGAPMWVQAGLNSGWRPEIVRIAVERVRASKRYERPYTYDYLLNPIIREHRRAAEPMPSIAVPRQETSHVRQNAPATDWQGSRDAFRRAHAKLRAHNDGRSSGGETRREIVQLGPAAGRGQS